jgi:hypothetical protein
VKSPESKRDQRLLSFQQERCSLYGIRNHSTSGELKKRAFEVKEMDEELVLLSNAICMFYITFEPFNWSARSKCCQTPVVAVAQRSAGTIIDLEKTVFCAFQKQTALAERIELLIDNPHKPMGRLSAKRKNWTLKPLRTEFQAALLTTGRRIFNEQITLFHFIRSGICRTKPSFRK